MTHAHTASTQSAPARASRPVAIGEYRMGGMPQPMHNGSSRWFGAGLVAVLAGIGGVSAYHVMSSKHPELVSAAPLVPQQMEAAPAPVAEPVPPVMESAPVTPAPAQTEAPVEPRKVAPAKPVTNKDKPTVKSPEPVVEKPATPAAEASPPTQTAAPTVKEPEPAKAEAPKPEAPKTDAAPPTATSEVKPTSLDVPQPKVMIGV